MRVEKDESVRRISIVAIHAQINIFARATYALMRT